MPFRFKFSCINAVGESEVSDESNVARSPALHAESRQLVMLHTKVTTMPTTPDKCTAPFLANEEEPKWPWA